MGAQCSTGMSDGISSSEDPIYSEVRKALREMVPKMLDYQVSGSKKDFEANVEPYVKNSETMFIFNNGEVSTAPQLVDNTGVSTFSKAEMVSIDSLRVIGDTTVAVATMTVKCGYDMQPGTYQIARNTFSMDGSSLQSQEMTNFDKGAEVNVERVVRVGDRLRGKIRGKKEWITLKNDNSKTEFVTKLRDTASGDGEYYTYSTVLEKVQTEDHEDDNAWKLIQVTMTSRS